MIHPWAHIIHVLFISSYISHHSLRCVQWLFPLIEVIFDILQYDCLFQAIQFIFHWDHLPVGVGAWVGECVRAKPKCMNANISSELRTFWVKNVIKSWGMMLIIFIWGFKWGSPFRFGDENVIKLEIIANSD